MSGQWIAQTCCTFYDVKTTKKQTTWERSAKRRRLMCSDPWQPEASFSVACRHAGPRGGGRAGDQNQQAPGTELLAAAGSHCDFLWAGKLAWHS